MLSEHVIGYKNTEKKFGEPPFTLFSSKVIRDRTRIFFVYKTDNYYLTSEN